MSFTEVLQVKSLELVLPLDWDRNILVEFLLLLVPFNHLCRTLLNKSVECDSLKIYM